MSVVDPFLDPENIASQDFASKRKGYDPDEVRRYLRQLADAARQSNNGAAADLEEENRRLRSELSSLREKVQELEGAEDDEDGFHVTNLITAETTMVIETARAAASEILRKAEAEGARRRRELKELEQRVESEVSEKRASAAEDAARIRREVKAEVNQLRSQVEEETSLARQKADEYSGATRTQAQEFLRHRTEEAENFHESRTKAATTESAKLRSEAEEASENMRRSAEEDAATKRREAEEEAVAMVRAAEEEAAQLRAKAHAESEAAKTATAELRAGAAELSARLKAEAQSDAEQAAVQLRNEARLMITEAKTLRERILADLVKRRRVARQQLDQARAARDRLARSLEEVRRQLDEATGELEMAVPEARAAMDRVGTVGNEADDPSEVAALIVALDHPRPDRGQIDEPEPLPDKQEAESTEFDLASDDVASSDREFDAEPLPGSRAMGDRTEEPGESADDEAQAQDSSEPEVVSDDEFEATTAVPESELTSEESETDAGTDTEAFSETDVDESSEDVEVTTQAEEISLEEISAEVESSSESDASTSGFSPESEPDEEPVPTKSLFAGADDAAIPPSGDLVEEPPAASIFAPDASPDADLSEGQDSRSETEGVFGRPVDGEADSSDDEQSGHSEAPSFEEAASEETASTDGADFDQDAVSDGSADLGEGSVFDRQAAFESEEVSVVTETEIDLEESSDLETHALAGADDAQSQSEPTKAERRRAWKSKRQAATGGLFGLPANTDADEDSDEADSDAQPTPAGQQKSMFPEPALTPGTGGEVPAPFSVRDSALVRVGPDLRRRMKRALADDQSEVLDGLRRGKRKLTVKDLPDAEGSRQRFAKALETPLRQAAAAGAKSLGGRVGDDIVEGLVERVSRQLMEKVRSRVWESVTETGGGREEVLEPIRSHYRDIRAAELPTLAEEALAEAFALGAYASVPDGTAISWVLDPREASADPDCIDNSGASSVLKPQTFPSGHTVPPCGDRCRCLVLPTV